MLASRSGFGVHLPHMVSGAAMARASPRQLPSNLPKRYASSGFDVLVAPRHQLANKGQPSVQDLGEVGVVRGLPQEAVEAAKMPPVCMLLSESAYERGASPKIRWKHI